MSLRSFLEEMGLSRETKIWEAVKSVVPVVKAVNLSAVNCGYSL